MEARGVTLMAPSMWKGFLPKPSLCPKGLLGGKQKKM